MNYVDFSILLSVVVGVDGYKLVDLVNRSTIAQIKLNLWVINSKPMIKSMLISSHFHFRMLSS
jgi:hypothetical protein